jgi:hypothetical protein
MGQVVKMAFFHFRNPFWRAGATCLPAGRNSAADKIYGLVPEEIKIVEE